MSRRAKSFILFITYILLSTPLNEAIALSQQPIELRGFNTNDISFKDIGNEHFFGVLIPSNDYFFDVLPEKVSVPSEIKASKERPLERKALIQHVKTSKVETEKSVKEIIYTLSWVLIILGAILIGLLLFEAFKGHGKEWKIIVILLILWSIPIYFYYSHIYVYFDNASATTYQVFLDNNRKVELKPFTFLPVLVGTGIHEIKILESKTGKPFEFNNINLTYTKIGLTKWLIYIIYNIGQNNSYRIETGYYAPK